MRLRRLRDAGHADGGFTLLEVIVSLAVVGIVMAALAPFMATTIWVTNFQTERSSGRSSDPPRSWSARRP